MDPREQAIIEYGQQQGKSQKEIDAALVKFRSEQPRPRQGFGTDLRGDIAGIGTGIARAAEDRGTKLQEGVSSGNILQRGLRAFGQGAGFASDVIGETVLGAGRAVLPESTERAVGGVVRGGAEFVGGLEPVQQIAQRFERLKTTNPELAKDIDAVLGIGQLALDIGTAGIGGQAARGAGRVVGSGVKQTGRVAGAGTRLAGRGVEEIGGALTGTSQETLQQAFEAAYRGGDELREFTRALRSQTTPEELVNNLRAGIDEIDNAKQVSYSNTLQRIGDNPVFTNSILPSFRKKLNDFGIKVGDGGELNFSNSKFRTVPAAQTKLQVAYNEIAGLAPTENILSIDTSRQALRELLFAGDDPSARAANAIITEGIESVKNAGGQVDGYLEELARFSEDAEFLNEIKKSLATGDRASIDTTYRRLATSLKTNNERRMNLVKELDEITDGFVLSSVSGQQLSEVLPRGLFRQIGAGVLAGSALTGGLSIAAILPTLLFASPRVVGEFIRALGITGRKAKIIIDSINAARRTLDLSGLKLPVPGAVREGLDEQ